MTNEEFEKRMDFIIDHQARFAVDIEKLKERQDKFSEDMEKLKERQDKCSEDIEKLSKDVQLLTQATLANVSMMGKLIEAQKHTDDKIAQLSDRLNALINVVEKHITEDHKVNRKKKN